jgi:hypothetical protein
MINPSATRLAPWQAEPRQLWSLFDMLVFYARSFAAAISSLERAESALIVDCMLAKPPLLGAVSADSTAKVREALDLTVKELEKLPISVAIKGQAERLRNQAANDGIPDDTSRIVMLRLLQELKINFVEDLKENLFFCVPAQDKPLFLRPEESYWTPALVNSFSGAHRDLKACAQCLALGMWTASVFHAMRAVQYGLHRLSDRLGVSFARDIDVLNWNEILQGIDKKLKEMANTTKTPERDAAIQFGTAASSHFFGIKEAWRNYVMHGRSTYDEEQARVIAANVRSILLALV